HKHATLKFPKTEKGGVCGRHLQSTPRMSYSDAGTYIDVKTVRRLMNIDNRFDFNLKLIHTSPEHHNKANKDDLE
ncbi:MAG: hypothetical protein ACUVTL_06420, partial [Thermoproteota archaeon]